MISEKWEVAWTGMLWPIYSGEVRLNSHGYMWPYRYWNIGPVHIRRYFPAYSKEKK